MSDYYLKRDIGNAVLSVSLYCRYYSSTVYIQCVVRIATRYIEFLLFVANRKYATWNYDKVEAVGVYTGQNYGCWYL